MIVYFGGHVEGPIETGKEGDGGFGKLHGPKWTKKVTLFRRKIQT